MQHWRPDVSEQYMECFSPSERKYNGFSIARWGDFLDRNKLPNYRMPMDCITLLMPQDTHPEQGLTGDLFAMAA
jgi:hypothetical protein